MSPGACSCSWSWHTCPSHCCHVLLESASSWQGINYTSTCCGEPFPRVCNLKCLWGSKESGSIDSPNSKRLHKVSRLTRDALASRSQSEAQKQDFHFYSSVTQECQGLTESHSAFLNASPQERVPLFHEVWLLGTLADICLGDLGSARRFVLG